MLCLPDALQLQELFLEAGLSSTKTHLGHGHELLIMSFFIADRIISPAGARFGHTRSL